MKSLKIVYLWEMTSIIKSIKALFTFKIFKKALKKGKNNIFYTQLSYLGKTNSIKIISIVDNINNKLTKICFY